jgi:hypothetical protein
MSTAEIETQTKFKLDELRATLALEITDKQDAVPDLQLSG